MLAILESYVPNSGDAWSYTLDSIGRYFERILSEHASPEKLINTLAERKSDCAPSATLVL